MNKFVAILVALSLSSGLSFAASDMQENELQVQPQVSESPPPVGYVYVVRGEVLVSQGESKSHQVNTTEPIVPGTLINTGENSAVLLRFEDGLVVTMSSNSSLRIRGYHFDASQVKSSDVDLVFYQGGLRFISGKIGKQKVMAFKMLTQKATMRGGDTEFLLIQDGEATYSKVLAGRLSVTNSAGTAEFKFTQTIGVSSPIVLAAPVYNVASLQTGFDELLAIPVDHSLVIPPEPEPVPVPEPEPEPTPVPEPEPEQIPAPEPELIPVLVSVPELKTEPVPVEPAVVPEPVEFPMAPTEEPSCTCSCSCQK